MTETIWKSYRGINVTVDDGGLFCATVNGICLRQSCWEHLRHKIEEESKAEALAIQVELKCIVLINNDEDYGVQPLTLTGLNRRDSTFKWFEKVNNKHIAIVLPLTQENADLLEQLSIAKSTVRDIEGAIKSKTLVQIHWGGRIEATKYNEELANLKHRYDLCLGASNPTNQNQKISA